jgi:predicted phage terminase large subunit-like protein
MKSSLAIVRERYSYKELQMLQYLCSKYFNFIKVFFKEHEGLKFIVNWHHLVIIETLARVISGEITRLIINCPPGYSKTLLAVKLLIAYGLSLNKKSQNIHLSYSDDLAMDNSLEVKEIIASNLYQALFPGKLKTSTTAKKLWKTEEGGGLKSAPTGGQVTGFRAGRLEDGFSGLMVIDDPLKPEDAVFKRLRDKVNRRFRSTIKTRLARPETPIVLIMQRVHEDDPTGFLLKGGSGEKWHHLVIPAEIEKHKEEYPAEYTHGIEIPYLRPVGFTWPLKVDEEYSKALKDDQIVWSTQYQQVPTVETGEIFKKDWWSYYESVDLVNSEIVMPDGERVKMLYKVVYADTAMKTGEANDFSVFELWCKLANGKIALIDLERDKWIAPDLEEHFIDFCQQHKFQSQVNNMGIRDIKVEDKASGIGLIQAINKDRENGLVEITGIPRDKDKVSRAKSGAPHIRKGNVLLPRGVPWLLNYVTEFTKFNSAMTHSHDDQIDPTLDAIQDMLIDDSMIGYSGVI